MFPNRRHSAVWLHFDLVDQTATCKHCKRTISIAKGSFGNLGRHMKRIHPLISITFQRQDAAHDTNSSEADSARCTSSLESSQPVVNTPTLNQQSPSVTVTSNRQVNNLQQTTMGSYIQRPPTARQAQKIDRQLLKMIAKGHHSFRIVEEPEMKQFVHLVSQCPKYTMPSRKTLSGNLLDVAFSEISESVKTQVDLASAVCITTDGWTSRSNDNYIAITAHFIDNETVLRSYLLACAEFQGRHDYSNIARAITEICADFNITHKIAAVVTDNAPNVVKAVRTTQWPWIGCFAHSLNLVAKTAISKISNIVDKVKKLCNTSIKILLNKKNCTKQESKDNFQN